MIEKTTLRDFNFTSTVDPYTVTFKLKDKDDADTTGFIYELQLIVYKAALNNTIKLQYVDGASVIGEFINCTMEKGTNKMYLKFNRSHKALVTDDLKIIFGGTVGTRIKVLFKYDV